MRIQAVLTSLLFGFLLAVTAVAVSAQTLEFSARLAPFPVNFQTVKTITGLGQATATLTGNQLNIEGSFVGLQGPANSFELHLAPLALRGPAIYTLAINVGVNGKFSQTVTLNPEQIAALKRRELYLQINSQAAPEGNLRGWLLPAKE